MDGCSGRSGYGGSPRQRTPDYQCSWKVVLDGGEISTRGQLGLDGWVSEGGGCGWVVVVVVVVVLVVVVTHVNERHVKIERPDVEYQCRWEGCPRRGRGFNAR